MEIETKIEALRDRCRDQGIPLTQQKIEVYKALLGSKEHPSPESIYNQLKASFPTISLATVYNNLDSLGRLGLVRRINPLYDQARYDADLSSHTHFICVSCKKVEDMEFDEVDESIIPKSMANGNKVISKSIQYTGICKECQKPA